MKRRPSAATTREPAAFLKKIGSPPTLRNARTGELTPPGMYLQASSYRLDTTRLLRLSGAGDLARNHGDSAALVPPRHRGLAPPVAQAVAVTQAATVTRCHRTQRHPRGPGHRRGS